LSKPRPTPKPEDHPSSAVPNRLFNIFTATLHIGGRFFIRNLRTRHALLTGTHFSGYIYIYIYIYIYMLYHNGILFQIVAVSVVVRLSDAPCHNHDRLRIFLIARNTSTNIVQVLKVKVQTNKCRLYTVCIVSCYRFT